MHTARKIAATSTIALGLGLVSFALPGIAQAADAIDETATAPAATPTPEATDEPDAEAAAAAPAVQPQVDLDEPETTPTPTETPGDPIDPDPTTPAPTRPTTNPGDDIETPGTPGDVEEEDDSTVGDDTDDDSGSSDPGSGDSSSQAGDVGSGTDPVLGNGVAPESLQNVTPPADADQTLPAAGSPAQLPVLVLGLGLIVVGGVLVKRPYAARHRV